METIGIGKGKIFLPAILSAVAAVFGVVHWYGSVSRSGHQAEVMGDPAPPATQREAAQPAPIIAPDDEVHAEYAGSASCKECHEAAHAAWVNSNHGLAEREYRDDLDKAAFSPRQTLLHGENVTEAFLDADGLPRSSPLDLAMCGASIRSPGSSDTIRSASF